MATIAVTGATGNIGAEVVRLRMLGDALGKTLKLQEVPEAGALAGMLKAGMPAVLAEGVLELQRPGRNMASPLTSTVQDVTGKAPRSFEHWVKDHLRAFQ